MFDDKYGLAAAVLEGKKTMTRRIIPLTDTDKEYLDTAFDWDLRERVIIDRYAKYKVGEEVAVTQSYQTILDTVFGDDQQWKYGYERDVEESHEKMWEDIKGRTNKMFVKADLMPHQLQITDVRIERLQDISDEDCMCEGVTWDYDDYPIMSRKVYLINDYESFLSPCLAFAALINRICGKGTWESNPWVFAYSFELIKYFFFFTFIGRGDRNRSPLFFLVLNTKISQSYLQVLLGLYQILEKVVFLQHE